jgi:hypothetical protein
MVDLARSDELLLVGTPYHEISVIARSDLPFSLV